MVKVPSLETDKRITLQQLESVDIYIRVHRNTYGPKHQLARPPVVMAAEGPSAASLPPEAIALAGRLYDAARAGDRAIFEQALPAGLPANMTNDKGDSLVMLAAYYGHAELVSLLLQHGGDPNRLNDKGQSPLAGAVFKMHDGVIEVREHSAGIFGGI